MIEYLEASENSPGAEASTEVITRFDSENVRADWQGALARRTEDPPGAITLARTLIESVCKQILDDAPVLYRSGEDLPKLWKLVVNQLNLSPSQQQDEPYKSIMGACQNIVDKLAKVRNDVGDAHGRGRSFVPPGP